MIDVVVERKEEGEGQLNRENERKECVIAKQQQLSLLF
jgi:hypothetical protein